MTPEEALEQIRALAEEHQRLVHPAPYTTERALAERLDAILASVDALAPDEAAR